MEVLERRNEEQTQNIKKLEEQLQTLRQRQENDVQHNQQMAQLEIDIDSDLQVGFIPY